MKLDILLPAQRLLRRTDVLRIVAETADGSFGLLPRRRDCVAALAPGIFSFETAADGEVFVAVDDGVLIKAGADGVVSGRRAMIGADLGTLRAAVEREFRAEDELARQLREAMDKLEIAFLTRLGALRHG